MWEANQGVCRAEIYLFEANQGVEILNIYIWETIQVVENIKTLIFQSNQGVGWVEMSILIENSPKLQPLVPPPIHKTKVIAAVDW